MYKITDLKRSISGVNLEARVVWKSGISMVPGIPHASAIIEDETGRIKLNLWNDQTEKVQW